MNSESDVRKNSLGGYYEVNLGLKRYSFPDIARILNNFYLKEKDSEKDVVSKYLLALRRDYLIREVCAKPNSDYTKFLIGTFSISPFVVRELVSSIGVNVFLARDAARDFIAAKLMDQMGIQKNESCILYFSRRNLPFVYKMMREIEKQSSIRDSRDVFFKKLKQCFIENRSFRKEVLCIHETLMQCGILQYKNIRFIDTWASGRIFKAIRFAVWLFDNYEYRSRKLAKRKSNFKHAISFAVANNKKRVHVVGTAYDYSHVESEFRSWWRVPKGFYDTYIDEGSTSFPVISFRCDQVSIRQIKDWYRYYGIPFRQRIAAADICEFFTAQIFKGLNHFGSLNLGHPIEWSTSKQKVVLSSRAKQIGNLLRNILLINAVLGYQTNYCEPIRSKKLVDIREGKKRTAFLVERFGMTKYKALLLDRVLYDNCEHIVTAHSDVIDNFIQNVIATMDFFGYKNMANMSLDENYNFQYYLNNIKSIPVREYKESLNILRLIYSRQAMRVMLLRSTFYFVKEISCATQLKKKLSKKIETIIFDIDGTLTPVDQGIKLLKKCINKNIKIVFITGRPRSFCVDFVKRIADGLPSRSARRVDKIIFYCSNGSEAFSGVGTVYKKRRLIPSSARRVLHQFLRESNFKIVSEREYRIIASYRGENNNANKLMAYRNKIQELTKRYNLGIYLIKWGDKNDIDPPLFDSVDICSSSKKEALENLLKKGNFNHHVIIGDDPENSDREILGETGISVAGYGIFKTRAVINYILGNRK